MKWLSSAGIVLFAVASAGAQTAPLKVFVTSEPLNQQEWVAPGSQERADSARDIADAIGVPGKVLVVVPKRDQADLVVQVVERREIDTGAVGFFGGGSTVVAKPLSGRAVAAIVYVGDGHFRFVGVTKKRYWSFAAGDLVDDLKRWAADNRERIVANTGREIS
jgi:hypothetical protein